MINDSPFSDELLTSGIPPMLTLEHSSGKSKPTILIYASCHGRTLADYFKTRQDLTSCYNIVRLETSVMLPAILNDTDSNLHKRKSIVDVFQMADVIVTYNMGARHGQIGLDVMGKNFRPDARVITFVAPNFSCFCPFGYGYTSTMPILNALDKGQTPERVWADFERGDLDCLFPMRWRLEIGRLIDKQSYHDIGLADFIIRNHRKAKLWMAPAHPTMIPMAYVGSEVCDMLGFPKALESSILAMDYMLGAVGGQPETDYEFDHYKFAYPQRHREDAGGMAYYRQVFDHIVGTAWKSGGFLQPASD